MSVVEIITICLSVAFAVYSVVSNVIMAKGKTKEEKANAILQILGNVPIYIKQAESIFGKNTGPAKCEWVATKIQFDAVKANVEIDDNVIYAKIEETLDTPEKKKEVQTEETRTDIKEF